MSLVESAVQKAKRNSESGSPRKTGASKVDPRADHGVPRTQRDETTVEDYAVRSRELPVVDLDRTAIERNGVLPAVDDNTAHRAYRILRTRVQQRMQAEGWHSVAVTASGESEGKTLTSINLAIALARDVSTWVYLVDLDLQRPAVASTLGLKFEKGISDYLDGKAQFEEILCSPGIDRLCIIPNRRSIENSSDVLGTPRMRELHQAIAEERPRPLVIFDMPPLLLSDDMLKFSKNVDCTLLVATEGVTSRASLQRASEVLQEMKLLGVVLNRSAEREESGYY